MTDFKTGFYCFPKPPTPPDNKPDLPGYARTFIQPSSLPHLTPYFLEPDGPSITTAKNDTNDPFSAAHAAQLLVKTLLIDPFAPLHVYSGILPVKSLQLPAWTLSEPMRNMTAFFSMGPLLLTRDVPKAFDVQREASATSWLEPGMQQGDQTRTDAEDIKMAVAGTKG